MWQPLDNEEEERWTTICKEEPVCTWSHCKLGCTEQYSRVLAPAREGERGGDSCGTGSDVGALMCGWAPLVELLVEAGAGISPRSNATTHSHNPAHLLSFWCHNNGNDNRNNKMILPRFNKNIFLLMWTLSCHKLITTRSSATRLWMDILDSKTYPSWQSLCWLRLLILALESQWWPWDTPYIQDICIPTKSAESSHGQNPPGHNARIGIRPLQKCQEQWFWTKI